jgi:large subunit ribosomal protein L22
MKTVARLRYFGVPSLKIRRFATTIKGEPVEKAMAILDLQSSPTCQALAKLLRSAVANAQHNNQLAPENLVVANVIVDQGPTMKRIKPRARGRAYRILKRSSHVTIEVDLRKDLRERAGLSSAPAATATKAPASKAAAKTAATKTTAAKTTAAKGTAAKSASKTASKTTGSAEAPKRTRKKAEEKSED